MDIVIQNRMFTKEKIGADVPAEKGFHMLRQIRSL